MAEDAGQQPPSSLDAFSKRLDAARGGAKADAENARAKGGRGTNKAYRLSSDMLAALLVGLFLGWGVDRLLGTKPWALVAGVFFGFAAGILNVARTMKAQQTATIPPDAAKEGLSGKAAHDEP